MDTKLRPSAPRFACRALPPERFLIPNVHLFDPVHGIDTETDILVEDGKIAKIGPRQEAAAGVEVLDLAGCWVFPGLVDPHTHLRTPGYEYKEDIASGSRAAAAGGYVAVVAMANTDPVVDCGSVAGWILDQAGREAAVRIGQVGAVSKGLAGEEMSEMFELAGAGVAAFSDDGKPVSDTALLLSALRYTRGTERPLLLHLEDRSLSQDGVMHEGKWSARTGLRGIPAAAETAPLAQDLELVRYSHAEQRRIESGLAGTGSLSGDSASGVPLVHFQHLSTAGSVELMRRAKREGLPVTAEATPLHLLLTDERLTAFDPNCKVNPPIRSAEDREALITGLAEGVIDCIGTDHAPHAAHEKEVPLEQAAFGSIGLETAFAALYGGLVKPGRISLERLIEAMSAAPCRILGIPAPRLVEGAPADFFVADLNETWEVTPAALQGKSKNSAFMGETLTGRVCLTVVDGARRFARAQEEA